MDLMTIGMIGATIIIFSWIYETFEELKERKSFVDLKFAALNLVGTIVLSYYSFVSNLPITFYLNIMLAVFVGFEIAFTIYLHRTGKFKKGMRKRPSKNKKR
jgi:chromate transport protein ChrA